VHSVPSSLTRADGSALHPSARDWFNAWASSAQADSFGPWHWLQLEMGALLVDRFYEKPSAALSREIRAIEGVLSEVVELASTDDDEEPGA
jgi:hypothetical protein